MHKELKIGVFGFGCVGQGLQAVLSKTKGIKAEIAKICVRQADKERSLPRHFFTTDRDHILDDDSINVVVELIDDAAAAYDIVTTAMKRGKAVVTANKKMVAEHLTELRELQELHGVPILYEGAVCASIPIIRNLEEYYDNDLVNAVHGIFNGSTNYILTKLFEEDKSFSEALKEAQDIGFAESDPTLDVEGYDPKYKLAILLAHVYGLFVSPEEILNFGIQNISSFDIQFAKEKGYRIKLVAQCVRNEDNVFALVAPQFVDKDSTLFAIENEFNGVTVEGAFSENQVFIGKGAGSYPTGSAVLSDVSALTYNYKYEYKKKHQQLGLRYSNAAKLEVFVRFDTEGKIDLDDFESILETYSGRGRSYVIGTISLDRLVHAEWLREEGVSFFLTPNSKLEKVADTVAYTP